MTWARIAGAALLVALLGRHGGAASSGPLSVEDMTDLASDIVVGRVVRSEARWQGRLIVTVSTIRVSEAIKGRRRTDVEVTALGGTAVHPTIGAPVTLTVSEQAAFGAGEEVLLFLAPAPRGARQVVGGSQGKLVVREDAGTGTRRLPVGPKRLRVVREPGARTTLAAETVPLDAMRARIRARIERGAR